MNLFWLDTDLTIAAQAHHDVHVRKMLLEGVQLLCTAFEEPLGILRVYGRGYKAMSPAERLAADLLPYTHTHLNHPCAVWTRASRGNFDAAIALCQALAAEYSYRFDKVHASEAALAWVIRHRSAAQVPVGPMTPYALAMPEKYRDAEFDAVVAEFDKRPDALDLARLMAQMRAVHAYRTHYRAEKRGHWRKLRNPILPSVWVPAKWTRRNPPEWFVL